ncbi:acetyl esterase/lipase [Naumannella cuiyingiana]|uniref:Acetyl esterase/lipase n=1 Tax=Naumannella cuiyingiana TaxID=1347891 RepID=A0A7Z0D7L2_9ACTN|nr:alpha/beta hydrolase [Naumannella cuiyingiana]NYI70376.1 acetyl esterase/lipase [Naumannella cuiyingiana]
MDEQQARRARAAEEDANARLRADAVPPGPVRAYGEDPDELVEVFGPADGPAVVFVHGGFWRPATDRAHARTTARALGDAGYAVHLAEYPRTPGDPDRTLTSLTRLAGTPAAGYGRGVDTLGEATWLGHSAGGHLVLWLAARGLIAEAIALAPVADLAAAREQGLGRGAVAAFFGDGDLARWDPRSLAGADGPGRVTVLHGTDDVTVPIEQGRAFPESLVELPGAHHFDVIDPESPHFREVVARLPRGGPAPSTQE